MFTSWWQWSLKNLQPSEVHGRECQQAAGSWLSEHQGKGVCICKKAESMYADGVTQPERHNDCAEIRHVWEKVREEQNTRVKVRHRLSSLILHLEMQFLCRVVHLLGVRERDGRVGAEDDQRLKAMETKRFGPLFSPFSSIFFQ